jgi:dihydroorotate dehydrogenase
MSATLNRDGVNTIAALRDCDVDDWAAKAIPT